MLHPRQSDLSGARKFNAGRLARIGDGAQTAVANTDAHVAANALAEYFSVNPGQQAVFISTSTSADIVRWSKWRNATLQIELHLVLPPSANQLWTRTRKGLRKTDRYTLWLAAAGWTAKVRQSNWPLQIDAYGCTPRQS